MNTTVRVTTVGALLLTTALIGCARRPSLIATSPAPSAGATESVAAAPRNPEQTVVEERREIAAAERPAPSTFVENANVRPIYFDFDRYDIRPGDAKVLQADAAWLKTHDMLILIEGQCDERGTSEYNIALGDRRARATMNYLMSLGVATDRMTTVSYGKERPVCTEHGEACWALNRRAHIVVKPRG